MARCFVTLGYLDPKQDPAPLVRVLYIMFEGLVTDRDFDPRI